MSLLKLIKAQLGLSTTPANNFTLDASADNGTMKLARNSGQDIMTVDAAGFSALSSNLQIKTAYFSGIATATPSVAHSLNGITVAAKVVGLGMVFADVVTGNVVTLGDANVLVGMLVDSPNNTVNLFSKSGNLQAGAAYTLTVQYKA